MESVPREETMLALIVLSRTKSRSVFQHYPICTKNFSIENRTTIHVQRSRSKKELLLESLARPKAAQVFMKLSLASESSILNPIEWKPLRCARYMLRVLLRKILYNPIILGDSIANKLFTYCDVYV